MANPSQDYINFICSLYGSSYDDRIENTAPPTAGDQMRIPGEDWMPGVVANHKSLGKFQKELKEQGINLSTSKIKKILITGGLWTTETTRTIQKLFQYYTGEEGFTEAEAIKKIAAEKKISVVSVSVSLPYSSVVYNLPTPSANAKRCQRWKERKAIRSTEGNMNIEQRDSDRDEDYILWLWKEIIAHEGQTFTTCGRRTSPGISFTYTISRSTGAGGHHYSGLTVDGYGNELWITTADGKKKKSISRSTVNLAFRRAIDMNGIVKGPKALGVPGAGSYLYPLFKRLEIIKSQ